MPEVLPQNSYYSSMLSGYFVEDNDVDTTKKQLSLWSDFTEKSPPSPLIAKEMYDIIEQVQQDITITQDRKLVIVNELTNYANRLLSSTISGYVEASLQANVLAFLDLANNTVLTANEKTLIQTAIVAAIPDIVKELNLRFFDFIKKEYENSLGIDEKTISPIEAAKRSIMFDLYDIILTLLGKISKNVQVLSEQILFLQHYQEQYTERLTRTPLYLFDSEHTHDVVHVTSPTDNTLVRDTYTDTFNTPQIDAANPYKSITGYNGLSIEDIIRYTFEEPGRGGYTLGLTGADNITIYGSISQEVSRLEDQARAGLMPGVYIPPDAPRIDFSYGGVPVANFMNALFPNQQDIHDKLYNIHFEPVEPTPTSVTIESNIEDLVNQLAKNPHPKNSAGEETALGIFDMLNQYPVQVFNNNVSIAAGNFTSSTVMNAIKSAISANPNQDSSVQIIQPPTGGGPPRAFNIAYSSSTKTLFFQTALLPSDTPAGSSLTTSKIVTNYPELPSSYKVYLTQPTIQLVPNPAYDPNKKDIFGNYETIVEGPGGIYQNVPYIPILVLDTKVPDPPLEVDFTAYAHNNLEDRITLAGETFNLLYHGIYDTPPADILGQLNLSSFAKNFNLQYQYNFYQSDPLEGDRWRQVGRAPQDRARAAKNNLIQQFIEDSRSRRGVEKDKADQVQGTVDASQQAITTTTGILQNVIRQLQTILGFIFR